MNDNMTPGDLKNFWGNHIKIRIDDKDLDFVTAKEIAKDKATELAQDPMLLSWYSGRTGDYFPKLECGSRDKPVWILFAESRGADIAVNINDGEYIFLYLSL
jgi:hypothetical protein